MYILFMIYGLYITITLLYVIFYISYCKKKICQAKFSFFFFEEGKYYVSENLILEMI